MRAGEEGRDELRARKRSSERMAMALMMRTMTEIQVSSG